MGEELSTKLLAEADTSLENPQLTMLAFILQLRAWSTEKAQLPKVFVDNKQGND